ncbi:MAG: calcium-binding protein [Leptolyngbyaceae cyanobacterium SL_7_1]|nr:calcium-binding protein [Leptolyngbyaceae cyanobacterium SL_7_1]
MAVIIGTEGVNILEGTLENDAIYGFGAVDRLSGLDGDDVIYGDRSPRGVDVGVPGDDSILGGNGNDRLYGDDGNDYVRGEDGNDRIYGGNGNDRLYGDNGNDIVSGGNGIDRIYGGNGNDRLYGGDGNDRIEGGFGNDTLSGGLGADTLIGGWGNDSYYVTTGDRVIELPNQGIDTMYSAVNVTLPENIENLVLTGADPIYGFGNELNNVITGNTANNALSGMEGDDQLNGGNGDDNLIGGSGNDRLNGGDGNDLLSGVRSFPIVGNNPGEGEVDWLTGGDGNDRFALGDMYNAYYATGGGTDFAMITDLSFGDVITLNGSAEDYVLQNQFMFLPELGGVVQGTAIQRVTGDATDMVGFVQNAIGLNLDSAVFDYASIQIAPIG